ncbi:hypothetical protein L3Q82_007767 [Scortum barcoo]|uniref:Uncharacterized protein n=1 Tax=Scortum barcoo TaxID=214431 RepID=A0ACB8WNY0_9TELE|nr:hypothetical protein L3Q82_007767 [Scortum barcoo]
MFYQRTLVENVVKDELSDQITVFHISVDQCLAFFLIPLPATPSPSLLTSHLPSGSLRRTCETKKIRKAPGPDDLHEISVAV